MIASKTVNSRQKFKALMELLDDWRNRLEYINSGIRTLPEQRSESHHVNMDGQTAKQVCWLHKSLFGEIGDHPIWRCREFRTKNVQERLKLLKENNACQACLLTGCPGAINPGECKKGFKSYQMYMTGNNNLFISLSIKLNTHFMISVRFI